MSNLPRSAESGMRLVPWVKCRTGAKMALLIGNRGQGSQRQSDNPPMSMSRDTYQQAQPRHHHSSSEYRASYSSDGQGGKELLCGCKIHYIVVS